MVAISDKLQHLEVVNASLSSRLSELAETQQRLSSDIVLGGFKYKSGVNLRNLAFIVLKSIHTELELRDIISARPLRGKDRPTEPSTSGLSTNSTAPSDTTSESSTSEPSRTALSSQQIIVSFIIPSLAQAIIHSKIKLKKIHTSDIDKDLLQTLESPSPLAPGLINVNEFLPTDIYKLHQLGGLRTKRMDFSLLFAVEEYLQDRRLPINQLSLILKLTFTIL